MGWAEKINLASAAIPKNSISQDTDRSYCVMICSNRPDELGKAIESYTMSLEENKHNVPVIAVLDSNTPNWKEQLPALQEKAKTCKGDVFLFTPEQKQRCKEMIIADIAQEDSDLAQELESRLWDKMLGSGVGANKDWGMLLTMGFIVMVADDDIRPFGLEFKDLADFRETDNLTEGIEVNTAYDAYTMISEACKPISGSMNSVCYWPVRCRSHRSSVCDSGIKCGGSDKTNTSARHIR